MSDVYRGLVLDGVVGRTADAGEFSATGTYSHADSDDLRVVAGSQIDVPVVSSDAGVIHGHTVAVLDGVVGEGNARIVVTGLHHSGNGNDRALRIAIAANGIHLGIVIVVGVGSYVRICQARTTVVSTTAGSIVSIAVVASAAKIVIAGRTCIGSERTRNIDIGAANDAGLGGVAHLVDEDRTCQANTAVTLGGTTGRSCGHDPRGICGAHRDVVKFLNTAAIDGSSGYILNFRIGYGGTHAGAAAKVEGAAAVGYFRLVDRQDVEVTSSPLHAGQGSALEHGLRAVLRHAHGRRHRHCRSLGLIGGCIDANAQTYVDLLALVAGGQHHILGIEDGGIGDPSPRGVLYIGVGDAAGNGSTGFLLPHHNRQCPADAYQQRLVEGSHVQLQAIIGVILDVCAADISGGLLTGTVDSCAT